MGYFDLIGLGHQALQERLNGPGLAIPDGLPKKGCDIFGAPPVQEGSVKALFELQPAVSDASRITGLPGLPTVWISRLEPGLRIPGLAGLEFSVFGHRVCSGLLTEVDLPPRFGRYRDWTDAENRQSRTLR